MPDDRLMTASLAFRKNEQAILRGDVPNKYLRLLPHIRGNRILEVGSAEGVLSLLLARQGKDVIALERRIERHESAQALREAWGVTGVRFLCGDIRENLSWLKGVDTFVAVRVIYYFQDDIDVIFADVSERVSNVVLCGNGNRARWWREGLPNRNDRADNYYASHEGMTDLLLRHGYRIETVIEEGDPIVVGIK